MLEPNDTGISADLLWIPRTSSFAEGYQYLRRRRGTMQATRFNQFGYWKGEIRYAGKTVRIDPTRVYGTKDRSWGIRPVGDPDMGGAPPGPFEMGGIFFLWAPLHWPHRCTHAGIFENNQGVRWHWDGMIVPVYDDPSKIPLVDDPGLDAAALRRPPDRVPAGHAPREARGDHQGRGRREEERDLLEPLRASA